MILPYYVEEYNEFGLLSYQTRHVEEEESNAPASVFSYCGIDNPPSTIGFGWISLFEDFYSHIEWYSYRREWSNDYIELKQIDGVFSRCPPLEVLFQSALDCLYNIECLELILYYFPNFISIHLDLSNYRLTSLYENISVNDHFRELFVKERLIKINYSEYYDSCAPSLCTYADTDRTDFSYATTLFISLYGGLVYYTSFN
ncbi:hypothetical protein I4U23_028270 [Adineta vaga]|nr:hypothetical protein I4U23_028270 [Adineta vaga]